MPLVSTLVSGSVCEGWGRDGKVNQTPCLPTPLDETWPFGRADLPPAFAIQALALYDFCVGGMAPFR